MAYEPKITDKEALEAVHPDLFKVDMRRLKKILVAAKTLNQKIPGAELVEVFSDEVIKRVEEGAEAINNLVGTDKTDPLAHIPKHIKDEEAA